MLKYILLVSFFIFQPHAVYAEEPTKILLHINDTFKLGHLNKSVKNLRNELGQEVEIRIVVNGKAVQVLLKDNLPSADIINNILHNKADIGLCHNALRNNNVTKDMLIEGLRVLPEDGNVTIIGLQKTGYIYIKM